MDKNKTVTLDRELSLDDLIAVCRFGYRVELSDAYIERVKRARSVVEEKVANNEVVYGTTTGFGSLVNRVIPSEDAEKLQRNDRRHLHHRRILQRRVCV